MVDKWVRPRRCDAGHCVEVSDEYGSVFVRNSKDPQRTIVFDDEEWSTFLEAVKRGEFDL
jgi:Domain of unknown function (DUF397)